jgi:hypothetical protein
VTAKSRDIFPQPSNIGGGRFAVLTVQTGVFEVKPRVCEQKRGFVLCRYVTAEKGNVRRGD